MLNHKWMPKRDRSIRRASNQADGPATGDLFGPEPQDAPADAAEALSQEGEDMLLAEAPAGPEAMVNASQAEPPTATEETDVPTAPQANQDALAEAEQAVEAVEAEDAPQAVGDSALDATVVVDSEPATAADLQYVPGSGSDSAADGAADAAPDAEVDTPAAEHDAPAAVMAKTASAESGVDAPSPSRREARAVADKLEVPQSSLRDRLESVLAHQVQLPLDIDARHAVSREAEGSPRETREALLQRLLDPTLTLQEAATLLGVCTTTVRRYTDRGLLRCFRTPGNQRRFHLTDVLDFMERQERI